MEAKPVDEDMRTHSLLDDGVTTHLLATWRKSSSRRTRACARRRGAPQAAPPAAPPTAPMTEPSLRPGYELRSRATT